MGPDGDEDRSDASALDSPTLIEDVWQQRTPPRWLPRALLMVMVAVAGLVALRSIF